MVFIAVGRIYSVMYFFNIAPKYLVSSYKSINFVTT